MAHRCIKESYAWKTAQSWIGFLNFIVIGIALFLWIQGCKVLNQIIDVVRHPFRMSTINWVEGILCQLAKNFLESLDLKLVLEGLHLGIWMLQIYPFYLPLHAIFSFFLKPKVQKWGSCLMDCAVDIWKCCLKLCECIGQDIKTCLSIECVHYILSVHFVLCVHLQLICLGGCCCQAQL
jgi:hypothetical protein